MEQQIMNYYDGDVIVFERFGDIYQASDDGEQWTVQQRFAAMNMVVLVICYQGTVSLRLNHQDYEASSGKGFALLPSAVIERLMVSPDVHVRGFGFSVTAMDNMFHTYRRTWQEALSLNDRPLVQLSDAQMRVADHLYQIVKLKQQMTDCRHYRPMIRSLMQSLLYMLADIINKTPDDNVITMPQRESSNSNALSSYSGPLAERYVMCLILPIRCASRPNTSPLLCVMPAGNLQCS